MRPIRENITYMPNVKRKWLFFAQEFHGFNVHRPEQSQDEWRPIEFHPLVCCNSCCFTMPPHPNPLPIGWGEGTHCKLIRVTAHLVPIKERVHAHKFSIWLRLTALCTSLLHPKPSITKIIDLWR